jgi:hypothetical protein
LLVGVVILGTAGVALLGSVGTSIIASAQHRNHASSHVVLVAALESVKQQSYVPCTAASTSSYVAAPGASLPAGWTPANVAVTAVRGWDGAQWVACPAADHNLELITITTTSPDGRSVRSVDLVKRDET